MRKMIQNPYIVGNPIEDSRMFFGRDDDFAYLTTKMAGAESGGMFVLCGTRRSGKTSVLFQILKGRLGDSFLPALIDMQSFASEGDEGFIQLMARKIAAAYSIADDDDLKLLGQKKIDFQTQREAFLGFCRQARARNKDRILVLMFDEYEIFEDAIGEGRLSRKILALLGDMTKGDSGIFVVMAGSTKLEERDSTFWAPCLTQSMHQRISFLSDKDAMSLICEPVADLVQYDDQVPELIIELGAGQPFYTQVICQGLVDHLNDHEKSTASVEDVQQVVSNIVDNPLPHMIFTWGAMSDLEKIAMAAMAQVNQPSDEYISAKDILQYLKEEKIGITLKEDRLNEALAHLFYGDLLSKKQGEDQYSYRMGIWHHWVYRMHSVWQVLEEIRADGRKPGQGIISLARRRLRRTAIGATLIAMAMGLWFVNKSMEEPEYIEPPPPDSTLVSFSTVPSGGRFFLDNHELGIAPQDSIKVPVGDFEYRAELDGYWAHTDSISLIDDGTIRYITVSLKEKTGSIHVSTTPDKAEIIVNGELLPELTPTTISNVSASELHNVRVRLAGYLPAAFSNQRVFADSTIELKHDFRKPRHSLTITTTPSGAQVYWDGKDRGISPLNLASEVEGSHQLKVSAAGYHEVEKALVVPVPRDRFDVVLTPLPPGLVQLHVQPYADIYLDGELIAEGAVMSEKMLPVGKYTIEFKHPHSGNFSKDISITSGDTVEVRHIFGR